MLNLPKNTIELRTDRTDKPTMIFLAEDPKVIELLAIAIKFRNNRIPILITGDTGTGKTLLAHYIHGYNNSRPFQKINSSAIPSTLVESALFGHTKGAFTTAHAEKIGHVAKAHNGTLFLDEIGDLSYEAQTKILEVIEEGSFYPVGSTDKVYVNIRVIAASNKPLAKLAEENIFRKDLYYRLNGLELHLPPLNDREDILFLAQYFLKKFIDEQQKPTAGFSASAISALLNYDWPGNIRQLANIVEKAIVIANDHSHITPEHLSFFKLSSQEEGQKTKPVIKEMEKNLILQALKKTGGNQKEAGKILGISPRMMVHKMKLYGIKGKRKKSP